MQERRNYIANALELHLLFTNPLQCEVSGRQNQRPIVPDEWHNHTGRVAVTVDLSDGRVAIIEQNTKQSNYLKLRISHTPDIISESWKLLWREQVISHM